MQRVVPQILQGMEGFDKKDGSPILFMGATNVPWQLDPAVLRPGPIRREGLHPAARPARAAEDARHLPRQAPGRATTSTSTRSPNGWKASAAPTSSTSATAPPSSRSCVRRRRGVRHHATRFSKRSSARRRDP